MDANGDGVLSRDEFVTATQAATRARRRQQRASREAPPCSTRSRRWIGTTTTITRSEWVRPGAGVLRPWTGTTTVRDARRVREPVPSQRGARFRRSSTERHGIIDRNEWPTRRLASTPSTEPGQSHHIDEYLNQPRATATGRWSPFAHSTQPHNGVINRGEWRGETLSFDPSTATATTGFTLDEYVNQTADATLQRGTGANDMQRDSRG